MTGICRFFFIVVILALLVVQVDAATVTVTTTITAALESLDYNDGVPDVVIIPSGTYDEQLTPNGNAGVDSTAYPTVFTMTPATVDAAFSSHTDPLTLRGQDANDPPILTYITGAGNAQQPYGMFPNNPSDFFEATIVHCGNNVTYENVEIRHGTLGYSMNGMSSGTVFRNCLFTNGTTVGQGHDDYWDANNNIDLTSVVNTTTSADVEYTFVNCLWDGTSTTGDGSLFDSTFFYFHGFDSIGQPNTFLGIGGWTATGCVMKNWDDVIFLPRGREEFDRGIDHLIIENCYGQNIANLAIMEGAVKTGRVTGCVHDISGRGDFVRLEERSQGVFANVIIANNIVSGTTTSGRQVRVSTQTNASTVLQTADWKIVNNTFHGYNSAAIGTDGTPAAGNTFNILIANNIFNGDGSGTAIGINHTAAGGTFTVTNNGFFGNGGGDVAGGLTNTSPVNGDPQFVDTALNIPSTPGPATQGFQLSDPGSPMINQGDNGIWFSLGLANTDVDGTERVSDGTVDLGAQEVYVPLDAASVENWSLLDWQNY